MKVTIAQPEYSTDITRADELFEKELALFDQCDSTSDLIVFPEACDVPALAKGLEEFRALYPKYNARLVAKAKETAKRCGATLFFNGIHEVNGALRNTTYAIDKTGEIVGYYYKQHLTPGESGKNRKLGSRYSYEHTEPTIIEIDGVRYAFLTCYDFYFYEAFANIARYNPDVIIGCSHQRTDTNLALQIFSQNCAYNCNAYMVRSSVSMGLDSELGGGSMVVAPTGEVLCNMYSRVGLESVEIDPKKRYLKPMGFGNPDGSHHEYIEQGRRPWKYRPAGSAIVLPDALMPYPRVCAHRGFNTVAPENSMPAFGAAIALGAEEIEFDLWPTKDGEIVSIHDDTLERVSDGQGKVYEHTYEELAKLDFGVKRGERFKGLRILRFEDILKKFSCHTIMNIHITVLSYDEPYPEEYLKKIVALIKKYDCEKYVYFMIGSDTYIKQFKEYAPKIPVCVGAGQRPWDIVDRAIELGCEKVQFFMDYYNDEMIAKAKANGIICNICGEDGPEAAKKFIEMGMDTILTNDYLSVSNVVERNFPDVR